jgi:transcriptional regulator with XRE-family HTH domain
MPVYDSHLLRYEDLQIGQRMRKERQRRGLTLKTLSEQVSISVARLSELENDKYVPNVDQALAIEAALGLSASALIPADVSVPYQISRDADVRRRPSRELRLARLHNTGEALHQNAFWPLADHFVGRHMEPLLARVMPTPENQLQFCFHHQIEFLFGLRGTFQFLMRTPEGLRREVLNRGDCMCFQAKFPHSFRSLDEEPAEAIHVLASGSTPIESAFDSLGSGPVAYIDTDGNGNSDSGRALFLAERLRVLRDAHGWTVRQVSRLVGLTETQLLQIESGNRSARLDVLLSLARAYGRPLQELLNHTHEAGPYYTITRSADIVRIPSRRRCTPVEQPNASQSKTCQSLSGGFPTQGLYPYFIKLLNVDIDTLTLHEHHGQEFIYVLDGQLELTTYAEYKQVKESLGPGDCIYLDSSVPHLVRGHTRNPYSGTSATVIDVFWCPLGETYLFAD